MMVSSRYPFSLFICISILNALVGAVVPTSINAFVGPPPERRAAFPSTSSFLSAFPNKKDATSSSNIQSSSSTKSATFALDSILSTILSDVGFIALGLIGLTITVVNRLSHLDDGFLSDIAGQQSRTDLLAVFASSAVLLDGVSRLDVTSALSESVRLEGVEVTKPVIEMEVEGDGVLDDLVWSLGSSLVATPARSCVLVMPSDDGWKVVAFVGTVPSAVVENSSKLPDGKTPILDRFLKGDVRSKKETYLPTLQNLPGRTEFSYLPSNAQEVLLLPISVMDGNDGGKVAVLVLGGDTAKSFSPRDVAWCQVLASRMGVILSS